MQAGKLRHQVDILKVTITRSSFNDPIETFTTFTAPVWASVEPITFGADEKFNQDQVQSIMNYKITIRYEATLAITPAHQIRFGNDDYNIKNVSNLNFRDRTWDLMCEKVAT